MKAILCRPNQKAAIIEIENDLETLKKAVGGWIEAVYPFEDEAAIICNEEGKILNLPPNRILYGKSGEAVDVLCGDFLIVYAPRDKEDFESMPAGMAEKYVKKFLMPDAKGML